MYHYNIKGRAGGAQHTAGFSFCLANSALLVYISIILQGEVINRAMALSALKEAIQGSKRYYWFGDAHRADRLRGGLVGVRLRRPVHRLVHYRPDQGEHS